MAALQGILTRLNKLFFQTYDAQNVAEDLLLGGSAAVFIGCIMNDVFFGVIGVKRTKE